MIKKILVIGSCCFTALTFLAILIHFSGAFNRIYSEWWRQNLMLPEYQNRMSVFNAMPFEVGDTIFLGDSITFEGSWSELFPDVRTRNRGISGDTSAGVLERVEQISKARPEKVFLMIGINDLSLGIAQEATVRNILEIVRNINNNSPETEIYVQSILPREAEYKDRVESLNKRLELSLPDAASWINLYPHFLDEKEMSLRPELSNDGLHLKGEGYIIWQRLISKYVVKDRRSAMRLEQARISPVPEDEWTAAQKRYLEPLKGKAPFYNISATLARHISAAEKFNVWAYHVMGDTSTLIGRHREILILRVGWLCGSQYEWGQHKIFARNEGLSEDEIEKIKIGSRADGWTDIERKLLDATDELHKNSFINTATWNALSKEFTEQQMMDVVFAVGQYHMVSMALNSFGVQLDDGVQGF